MSEFNGWAFDLLQNWHFWLVLAIFSVGAAIQYASDALRDIARAIRWSRRRMGDES